MFCRWVFVAGRVEGYSVVKLSDQVPTSDELAKLGIDLQLKKVHGASEFLMAFHIESFQLAYPYVNEPPSVGMQLFGGGDYDAELAWWPCG